jgi:hypothetical protein
VVGSFESSLLFWDWLFCARVGCSGLGCSGRESLGWTGLVWAVLFELDCTGMGCFVFDYSGLGFAVLGVTRLIWVGLGSSDVSCSGRGRVVLG